jgi:hypothetical protein
VLLARFLAGAATPKVCTLSIALAGSLQRPLPGVMEPHFQQLIEHTKRPFFTYS